MKTRICVVVALALGLLATIGARPGAQEAEPNADPKPEFVLRTHDFRVLLSDTMEKWDPEPWPKLSFYGWPDNPNFGWSRRPASDKFSEYAWSHADEYEPPRFSDIAHVEFLVKQLAADGELESIKVAEYNKTGLDVSATLALHERIENAKQMLRNLLRARIHVELYRLNSVPQDLILADIPEGTLIGRRDIAHGAYALFSELTASRVTWSAEQSWHGTLPRSADQFYGEQWGIGALILHDGRIRVQAWHASLENTGIREWKTRCGHIQLPSGKWDATPGAAILPNGAGLVLQTGNGAFLFRVSTTTSIPNHDLDAAGVKLLNPSNAILAGDFTGRWLFSPADQPSRNDYGEVLFPNGTWDAQQDRGNPYPKPVWEQACSHVLDAYELLAGDKAGLAFESYGAMLLLKQAHANDADRDLAQAAREAVATLLAKQITGPSHHIVGLTLLRVPGSVAVPESIAAGKPTSADVERLRSIEGVKSVFERRVAVATHQHCDVVRAAVQNYLRGFDPDLIYSEHEKYYGTEIGSHSHGVQARVHVGPEGAMDIVAAWRHESELRKFEPDGDLKGETLERPQWSDVQFRLNDRTADGGILAAIQPINDSEIAVLVVTRTEVK